MTSTEVFFIWYDQYVTLSSWSNPWSSYQWSPLATPFPLSTRSVRSLIWVYWSNLQTWPPFWWLDPSWLPRWWVLSWWLIQIYSQSQYTTFFSFLFAQRVLTFFYILEDISKNKYFSMLILSRKQKNIFNYIIHFSSNKNCCKFIGRHTKIEKDLIEDLAALLKC